MSQSRTSLDCLNLNLNLNSDEIFLLFSALGAADVFQANMIAREMILSMGMGRRMGPVDLMHVASTVQDDGMLLRVSDSL